VEPPAPQNVELLVLSGPGRATRGLTLKPRHLRLAGASVLVLTAALGGLGYLGASLLLAGGGALP